MACSKRVMLALAPLWKAADAALLTQGVKAGVAVGKQLMRIALVTHVKDQPVFIQVKGPVQGHRQLHRPQIRGKMTDEQYKILTKYLKDNYLSNDNNPKSFKILVI